MRLLETPRPRGVQLLLLLSLTCVAARAPAQSASDGGSLPIGERSIAELDTPAGPLSYTPGRGLRFGTTGFTLGGFTNIKAEHEEQNGGEFTVDLLNFFLIYDYFTRFRAVAELQLKDVFIAADGSAGSQDFAFDVRRLFGDFTISDDLHLRAGTFLTPVGRWNLILTPPLTWTTEAPVIVEETFFDATTTGVMLHGSRAAGEGRLSYSLFSQVLAPLEDDPELDPADVTAGARLEYSLAPGRGFGCSYQATADGGRWAHLGGVHALWQHDRLELLGELLYQQGRARFPAEDPDPDTGEDDEPDDDLERASLGSSAQWGAFVQAVVEVRRPFYFVARVEHFDPPSPDRNLNLFTIGGVYKPLPFMAVKLEYRFTDRRDENTPAGLFTSFTTLF